VHPFKGASVLRQTPGIPCLGPAAGGPAMGCAARCLVPTSRCRACLCLPAPGCLPAVARAAPRGLCGFRSRAAQRLAALPHAASVGAPQLLAGFTSGAGGGGSGGSPGRRAAGAGGAQWGAPGFESRFCWQQAGDCRWCRQHFRRYSSRARSFDSRQWQAQQWGWAFNGRGASPR
jgi:hypothetical protein